MEGVRRLGRVRVMERGQVLWSRHRVGGEEGGCQADR
jgi:hypothetical protein